MWEEMRQKFIEILVRNFIRSLMFILVFTLLCVIKKQYYYSYDNIFITMSYISLCVT